MVGRFPGILAFFVSDVLYIPFGSFFLCRHVVVPQVRRCVLAIDFLCRFEHGFNCNGTTAIVCMRCPL